MSAPDTITAREVHYPDSDGKPMAENTRQFRWIVTLQGGLDSLFQDDPEVFVAGDLLWYPIEGDNLTRVAPDVMVAFGRPKGDRGSYQQWKEGHIPPQVVFEVLSPGNSVTEMVRKVRFYERHGVEELYTYDPDWNDFTVWIRKGASLQEIEKPGAWVSPRLKIRFELGDADLRVIRPDGKEFLSFVELHRRAEETERRAEETEKRAETERGRADKERQRADSERVRGDLLAERLKTLGIDPEQVLRK